MRSALVVAATITLALLGSAQAADQAPPTSKYTADQIAKVKPNGTVEIDATQFGLLVGGASGKGVLTYQGKTYPFTAKGVAAGTVGYTKVHAIGNVLFLNKPEDFSGTYTAVAAGSALVKGSGSSMFENAKTGVMLQLRSKSEGAALTVGVTAITVELQK